MLTSYLAKKYKWNVTGIDLDTEQIEIAKKDNIENEYLRFFETDATKLPFGDDDFDMILSFDVLHHIPDWYKAIEEISRALRPKGFDILSDLALPGFTSRIFKNLGVFAMDDIINHLNRNKFKIVYEEKTKTNIFGLTGHFSVVSQKSPISPNYS